MDTPFSDKLLGSSALVLAAREGSSSALAELFSRCRRYLLPLARQHLDRGLRVRVDASDLVQETLLDALRSFACFRGQNRAQWHAWLRRVFHARLVTLRRRHYGCEARSVARESSLAEPLRGEADVTELPARDDALVQDLRLHLDEALERLPEDYRAIILLRYREGCSFHEIAPLLNRTPDASRKLWYRAVVALRKVFEESGWL